jgi:hypothetical protein
MSLNVERWVPDVIKRVFPNDSFGARARSFDADVNQSAANAKTLHIPERGTAPGVTVNPSTPRGAPAQRTDSDVTFSIDNLVTDGSVVEDATDVLFLNYNKMSDILEDHSKVLGKTAHNRMLQAWVGNKLIDGVATALPTSQIKLTTGADNGSGFKRVTYADFVGARTALSINDENEDVFCVVDAAMYGDLLKIEEFVTADKLGFNNSKIPTGLIGRVLNIDVYERSFTPRYTVALGVATLQAIGSGTNRSIVFATGASVGKGMGNLRANREQRGVTYGGWLVNFEMLFGATRLRQLGVAVIVQDNA